MPQTKIEFLGASLDPTMPLLLNGRMKPEVYEDFVHEINAAIIESQNAMGWTPYAMLCLLCIGIALVLVFIALSSTLGSTATNPSATVNWVLVALTFGVFACMAGICYTNMSRPSRNCDQRVYQVCEEYSDEEANLHFFYRKNAATKEGENRFFIEVFVPDNDDDDDDDDDDEEEEEEEEVADEHEDEGQAIENEYALVPKPSRKGRQKYPHSTRKDVSIQDHEESFSSVSYHGNSDFPLVATESHSRPYSGSTAMVSHKNSPRQHQQQRQQQRKTTMKEKHKTQKRIQNRPNNDNNNTSSSALVNLTPEQLMELEVQKETEMTNQRRIV